MSADPLCLPRAKLCRGNGIPSHKLNGRTEHRIGQVNSFEARKVLDCNSVENPDHFFTLQPRLDDHGHLLLDCCPESVDKT